MQRLITTDDISETFAKFKQRGLGFLLSKFSFRNQSRTLSAFNDTQIESANWWNIDLVKLRWNVLITVNPFENYETYTCNKFLGNKSNLHMLSIGCGNGTHEIRFAQQPQFEKITAIDISDKLIAQAQTNAHHQKLKNISFEVADIYQMEQEPESLDIIYFHSSLHHFSNLEKLIIKLKTWLKPGGILVIHEYVGPNRFGMNEQMRQTANDWLTLIPLKWRTRYKTNKLKTHISGPGLLRMYIADPSEAVESEKIIPLLHKHFEVVTEKAFGTLMLMLVLKDIAHHFMTQHAEQTNVLNILFEAENAWMKKHGAQFMYGVYRKKVNTVA